MAAIRRGRLAVGVVLASRLGVAEPALHLEYRAHDGCPPEQAFLDELRRHNREVRLLESGIAGTELVVRIDRSGRGSTGLVELRTASDPASSLRRRVEGETCDDVVRALAFVTVMLLDASEPAARTEPSEAALPAPAPTSRPEPSRRPSTSGRVPAAPPGPSSSRTRERRAVALGMAAGVSRVFGATTLGGELFSELPLRSQLLVRLSLAYVPDSPSVPIGRARL